MQLFVASIIIKNIGSQSLMKCWFVYTKQKTLLMYLLQQLATRAVQQLVVCPVNYLQYRCNNYSSFFVNTQPKITTRTRRDGGRFLARYQQRCTVLLRSTRWEGGRFLARYQWKCTVLLRIYNSWIAIWRYLERVESLYAEPETFLVLFSQMN